MRRRAYLRRAAGRFRRDVDAALDRALICRASPASKPGSNGGLQRPIETTIASWKTPDGTRVLVVQEMEAEQTLLFDWFFKATGLDDEIEMPPARHPDVDRHVPIVSRPTHWLVDREPEARVTRAQKLTAG